ncbi:MAG TPA: PEP-CTERM sorting domain-containing protein [Tepidisphaeraceae bacterium]|jgi:hypothetical protein|nr:PEP-CTERM sorting domain-containing protein [Tepidisphaeraceae bacterium]
MLKLSRKAVAAVLSLAGICVAGSQVKAAQIYMNISDIHPPIAGLVGLDNTGHLVSLGGLDDFIISDNATPPLVFANSYFNITSGFQVGTTIIADSNNNSVIDTGDSIAASIGPGTFQIISTTLGVLLNGTFNGANLSTSVNASSVTINSGVVNGLSLTPTLALASFGIVGFQPDESFALNAVGIQPGVQVAGATEIFPGSGLYRGILQPFAVGQIPTTSGALDMNANLVIVPEPASIGLLAVGALAMAARRNRA